MSGRPISAIEIRRRLCAGGVDFAFKATVLAGRKISASLRI
jgi:hypothetical protein